MMRALRMLPEVASSRAAAAQQLADLGFGPVIATWMASNLEHDEGVGLRWHFDLDGVAAMLDDYWRVDAWDVLAAHGRKRAFHVVVGQRSDRLTPAALARLDDLQRAGAVSLHRLDAGHWVHTDDPYGLLAAMAATFAAT
jgi:hypothetical protein